jgi:hypothetical protein
MLGMRRTAALVAASLALLTACTPIPEQQQASPSRPPEVVEPATTDEIFSPTTASAACGQHFTDAATVAAGDPANANVDSFFKSAAFDCTSPDDWAAGVREHPASLGFDAPDDQTILWALETTCGDFEMSAAPVCQAAVTDGRMARPSHWPDE